MGLAGEIALALALGPPLWLCGAIGFDAVHWALHRMLRSRHAWLRALAWPHSVHHDWIDEKLEIHWDQQGRNVWCHIVPEYATQLAFTGALAALLPPAFPLVVGALQTAVFVGILRARGLDRNHRPVRLLDAYAPGPHTPPAYHALHHAYPDAYFSAYTKLVDALVGGGAALAGRRFALLGEDAFADALAAELSSWGVASTERWTALEESLLPELDVLVLCDGLPAAPRIEAFVAATRERRLPPEVWTLASPADAATARHYHRDVRVSQRTLLVRDAVRNDAARARRAARRAVTRLRRGLHCVPTSGWPSALAARWRFARMPARPPPGVSLLRHRVDALG